MVTTTTTPNGGSDARAAFAEAGVVCTAGAHAPFFLDAGSVWLVTSGAVDVFSVQALDGQPSGPRTHLFRAVTGEALFGAGRDRIEGERGLLAVGTSGTTLRRVAATAFRRLALEAEHRVLASALIERWVQLVYEGMMHGVRVPDCTAVPSASEARVTSDAHLRCVDRVAWVRQTGGEACLLGIPELRLRGAAYTPLAREAWLSVKASGAVVFMDTPAAVEHWWPGLDRLHESATDLVALTAARADAAERARLTRKAEANRSLLVTACASLVATLRPSSAGVPRHAAPTTTTGGRSAGLFEACEMVGAALGVRIKAPSGSSTLGTPDLLGAIARASRVRVRTVALRGTWWKQDNGPLLGFLAGDERPVAVLNRYAHGYVIHDPLTGTSEPVNEASAARLTPFASMMYRSFPETALRVSDVARFAFRGCGGDIWMVAGISLAAALLGLLPPIATGAVFNHAIPGSDRTQLIELTVLLLVGALAAALFEVTRTVALLRIEGKAGNAVQSAVWDRLLSLPLRFFRPYTAGELATRAMGIDQIRQVISGTTVTALVAGVFSLCDFGLLFYYSTTLAWWATLLIALALAIAGCGSYIQLRFQRGVMAMQAKSTGIVLQLLSSVAKLRVANAEVQAFATWAARFGEQRRSQYRVRAVGNWVAAFNSAYPVLCNMLIFWAAIHSMQSGTLLPTGDFLAFVAAFVACLNYTLTASTALLCTLTTIPLYEQAKPILATPPEVDVTKADPGFLSGEIEVQHVSFRYHQDGPAVLRDVTLRIRPGEFVALVGPSGSGKSTILRLLLGFEQPEAGAVYYDGQDLAGLDVQAVRRQIGAVLQNGRLMSGDIFTNIVGASPTSVEDAWEAARMAGFDEDIRQMPMGMHTVVSEGGGTLSGGQRQRLMIARAIVHRPRILLFDEATSALDNRTQAIVSASLERLQATRVVLAHRLSTIINADRIVVVQAGRIVEMGRYAELLAAGGVFASLASRQLV
jgi:ATP-binding cassette subfamily C protein